MNNQISGSAAGFVWTPQIEADISAYSYMDSWDLAAKIGHPNPKLVRKRAAKLGISVGKHSADLPGRRRYRLDKFIENIHELVEFDPNGGCWLWNSGLDRKGYGWIHLQQKKEAVHRVSWEAFLGPIADGLYVCHKCDNPPCCNPSHLFLGTHKENMEDMARKNRSGSARLPGELAAASKLTEAQAREIISRLNDGETIVSIAKHFPVGEKTISAIKIGFSWKHLERP